MGGLFIFISLASHLYGLNGIKSKTVGNGQHGTARWASKGEIDKTYTRVNYEPQKWRTDEKSRPKAQGIVVGCETVGKKQTIGLVDTGDVHCMMIGAAGVGKTAFWLYPNIEYACASGMSFMSTDTKGDIMRNYGSIASKYYGYNISVIDLRNPMRSHGNNLLHLVNKYMDLYAVHPDTLAYKAKAEKYAKIISKTIILSGMDAGSFGQNAYFYDAAEGVLTATILEALENEDIRTRALLTLAVTTGMRRGELVGLMWDDIDFDKQIITISRSVYKPKGEEQRIKATKSVSSNRTVYIPESCSRILYELKIQQASDKRHSQGVWLDSGFVFTDKYGKNISLYAPTRICAEVQAKYGLRHLKLHGLRHTCGSLMVEHGVDPETVKTVLGHESLKTTNRYLHPYAESMKDASEKMERIIRGKTDGETPIHLSGGE